MEAGVAAGGVAGEALYEGGEFGVFSEGVGEEGPPAGCVGVEVGGEGGGPGVQGVRIGWVELAVDEVDDAARGVEVGGDGVEFGSGGDDAAVGAGELHSSIDLVAGEARCLVLAGRLLEVFFAEGGGVEVADHVAGEFDGEAAFVPGPAVAFPQQPHAALRDVAQPFAVGVDEEEGVAVVGERLGPGAARGRGARRGVDVQGVGAVNGRGAGERLGEAVDDAQLWPAGRSGRCGAVALAAEFFGGGGVVTTVLEEGVGTELGVGVLGFELG